MTCARTRFLFAACLLLAWALVPGPAHAQPVGNKNVKGKLKSFDAKRSEIVLTTDDDKELKVPFSLARSVLPGRPLPTTVLISAPGSADLLSPKMLIHVSNVKFDWGDPHKLSAARVTLYPFRAPPENRLELLGDRESSFSALVMKTDPLEVRLGGRDVPLTVDIFKAGQKPMRFQVLNKSFTVDVKEVKVDLGLNFALAGKEAPVHAVIYTPAGTAQQLQVFRKDPVTADELKRWTKRK